MWFFGLGLWVLLSVSTYFLVLVVVIVANFRRCVLVSGCSSGYLGSCMDENGNGNGHGREGDGYANDEGF